MGDMLMNEYTQEISPGNRGVLVASSLGFPGLSGRQREK